MIRFAVVSCLCVALSACTFAPNDGAPLGETHVGGVSADIAVRPKARPDGFLARIKSRVAPPPAAARTEEQFDTTTADQREAAAVIPVAGGERALGRTIASLGSPTEPGFWMKTPLVSSEVDGRVVFPKTGKSVQVRLIPIDGPATAGSRLSLSALRLLEAPLTGLPEVDVFAQS